MEIAAENIRASGVIYAAYLMEQLGAFSVIDRILELQQQGLLPLGRGKASQALHEYFKQSAERLSETERRDLYARTLGIPGGSANVEPNRDFAALWLRFVA